ncbi:TIGR00730 family Rossman fold protein [Streptomyces sp. HC307]|uniref:LOG family protein n=1 Tax=Streptomyces flavusporus TaxID=3385496 RepID=UPI0039175708
MLHITVFCGASPGHHPVHLEAATAFGRLLVEADLGLVYGGASTGLMGALADAVLSNGGRAIGVMPHDLVRHEVAHAGLTQLHVVDSMHERKARMADLGDAFVALPGGFGTAEELFEILTWAQLGLHDKPCALLDTNGFYSPLLAFLRHAVNEGFIHQRYLDNVIVCDRPQDVLVQLTKHRALPHLFETA